MTPCNTVRTVNYTKAKMSHPKHKTKKNIDYTRKCGRRSLSQVCNLIVEISIRTVY